jgi:hypothetical protein
VLPPGLVGVNGKESRPCWTALFRGKDIDISDINFAVKRVPESSEANEGYVRAGVAIAAVFCFGNGCRESSLIRLMDEQCRPLTTMS